MEVNLNAGLLVAEVGEVTGKSQLTGSEFKHPSLNGFKRIGHVARFDYEHVLAQLSCFFECCLEIVAISRTCSCNLGIMSLINLVIKFYLCCI